MSTSTSPYAEFAPQPSDDPDDVLFTSKFGLRTIELNRPRKLNSLDASMIRKMVPRLLEWEKSDMANVILIKGAGPKAFCAGGDVAVLAGLNRQGAEGQSKSIYYFGLEYRLDHLIATCKKPYVALMDGITMGGGVGLSVHAPLRVATERTVFAMPEATIGFFPDVGASFFLPRTMPTPAAAAYLAMTSERLAGPDVLYAGVATHYLHSSSLPALEARLAELRFLDGDDLGARLRVVGETIDEFATGVPFDAPPMLLAGELRDAVGRCFDPAARPRVADVIAALEREASTAGTTGASPRVREWAAKTLATLRARSPTSVAVALRQMRVGAGWGVAETFRREFALACKFMARADFSEGVESRLVRKPPTAPRWEHPATLEELAPVEEALVDGLFGLDDGAPRLDLFEGRADFHAYPFASAFALPSEADVLAKVREGGRTQDEVLRAFVKESGGRLGVEQVVRDVLERRTAVDPVDGKAVVAGQ